MITIFLSKIINPLNDTGCQVYNEGALAFDQRGKIIYCGHASECSYINRDQNKIIKLNQNFIIPGFFDMHFHWVQDEVSAKAKDNLLDWLNKYTFPAEKKFANKSYSQKKAKAFFKKLSKQGTIGGAVWSSIHENALIDLTLNIKGNFIFGNTVMTQNSPDFLTQTKNEAIKLVNKLSKKFKSSYAFTPRFAIATDFDTMKKGSKIAVENNSFIQTHLSENKAEISFVKSIYKKLFSKNSKENNYTNVYNKAGVLTKNTLLAHGIYLSKNELKMISKKRSSVIHCPTSNAPLNLNGLGSGLFSFRKVEKENIKWALGSDIGAGPHLCMIDVINSFVDQNRKAKIKKATYVKGLYRSTLAGAKILNIDKTNGNLNPGKNADFLVLKVNASILNRYKNINEDNVESFLEEAFTSMERKYSHKLVVKTFLKGFEL